MKKIKFYFTVKQWQIKRYQKIGTTTSASNILFHVHPINFVLYSKDLLFIVLLLLVLLPLMILIVESFVPSLQ